MGSGVSENIRIRLKSYMDNTLTDPKHLHCKHRHNNEVFVAKNKKRSFSLNNFPIQSNKIESKFVLNFSTEMFATLENR